MSRPRPPLHDPYGLLRPPPPLEASTSLYGATPGSTISLPLPSGSPNRRTRQRGVSPSRTQHGEEYDDQPYLTNVVRHHGQVTLVPPVNQGRTRKVKKRRNAEAAASTLSLAETASTRPSSSTGPSRAGELRPRESPRRPRQGSGSRTISSPEFSSSPYPDYPPPSFEEVLALDRRNASSTTPTIPDNEVSQTNDTALPLLQIPTVSPGPSRNQTTATTSWEQDRLLGLSLEERVRREFERTSKYEDTSPSPRLDSSTRPTFTASASGTPTSATASDFLTPQDLTPSPSDVALPLSERESPGAGGHSEGSSPPPVPSKSPDLASPLVPNAADDRPAPTDPATTTEPQTPKQVCAQRVKSSSQGHEPSSLEQPLSQTIPSSSVTPLSSLLFTTRLRLDDSPETSPTRESTPGRSLSPEGRSQSLAESNRHVEVRRHVGSSPQKSPFPLEPLAPQTPNGSPQRSTKDIPHPSEDFATPPRGRSPSRPLFVLGSSLRAASPVKPSGSAVLPSTATLEPSQLVSPSTTPRRPPPPPPPRPRPRQIGAGVAVRVSAYEALLANAPKVPPPLPPRPRPRSQASTSSIQEAEVHLSSSRPGLPISETASSSGRGASERSPERRSHVPMLTHTTASRPPPPPPPPRSRGSLTQETSPAVSLEPQSQVNPPISSRPFPAPPVAGPSQRIPSPERAQIPTVQPQVLVPARIGPDGKLEIIPDADVIWLDKDVAKEGTGTPAPRNEVHRGGIAVTPRATTEIAARPSAQEIFNPFEDSVSSSVTPPVIAHRALPSQPASPTRSPAPISEPSNYLAQTPVHSTATSPPRLADDFEYTDLDLLISRLEENEAARQGANYEQLLTVGEVLGPARPAATRPELDLNVGLVEIQQRRVMKDGRVKLKLSLMGVRVDKCGICLTQFKNNESAVLLTCLHSFHTNCIMSWFVRQEVPACPHCRTPVPQ